MRKYFLGLLIFLAGISSNSFGRDNALDLLIKSSQYTEEGVKISYSVVNQKSFTMRNTKIVFKIKVDGKPVGCKEVNLDVPANSTGDEIMEVIIQAPCENKSCKVAAQIFDSTARKYRIDNWTSECPK